MKKKALIIFGFFLISIILIINSYWKIEYHTNFIEFITKSYELTDAEKKWLKQHGPIVYAADNNSPPLRYYENGEYKGIVLDYLSELSKEINHPIVSKPMIWNNALISLENGETDLCDMFTSEERSKKYLFSDPIYYERAIIVTSIKNTQIHSEEDILNLKIGVQTGDYAIEYLTKKYKNLNLIFTTDYEESVKLLEDNIVDVVVGDEPVLIYFIEKMKLKNKIRLADQPLYKKESVFGIPKNQKILQNIINKGISKLKKKNTIIKIQQNWFGISTPISEDTYSKKLNLAIMFFVVNLAFIFSIFILLNSSLKKEVDKRTKELLISKKNLQITFDGLTSLMAVIDDKYNIKNCNISFCNFFDTEKDKIINENCFKYFKNIGIASKNPTFENLFISYKPTKLETLYKRFYYEINIYPLKNYENTSKSVLVIINDITELKLSRDKLLQNNKMMAVGKLAAGVAHEIRNPLGLIRNYSYLIKTKTDDNEIKNYIENINNSVNKASKIIDNLLNFSRISDEEIKFVNIYNFINNILKLNRSNMNKKNIDLNIICEKTLSYNLNPHSLEHIFINILNNSIDAIKNKGIITIYCKIINKSLMIKIIDTGEGIDELDIENIFDPFFTTKSPGKGTGLGLYITYNEVKKMNGDIYIKSKKNKGTIVTIYING